jgi:ABC-type transporter Mla subunit MlaD
VKFPVNSRERAAGAFVLTSLVLVALFVVGAAVRNRWFHSQVVFHGQMVAGDGLREGSPVFLSGVEVGEIGRLAILDNNRVDVQILIWEEHRNLIRAGTRALARRVFGIGEKRLRLTSDSAGGLPLPPGSNLPIDERVDLLDAVATLDLTHSTEVLERTIDAADRMLAKLEEGNRFEGIVAAVDRLGPVLEKVEGLLGDPNVRGALSGVNTVMNAPSTIHAIDRAARLLAPERMDRVLSHSERLLARLDELSEKNGSLDVTLRHTTRLLGDGRVDRLLDTAAHLNDTDKLGRLLDNTAVVAEQLGRVGPTIPTLARELTLTLREAVITLKALQETWLLESKAKRARKDLERGQQTKP